MDGTLSVEDVARILSGIGRGDAFNDALLPATGGLHEDVPFRPTRTRDGCSGCYRGAAILGRLC